MYYLYCVDYILHIERNVIKITDPVQRILTMTLHTIINTFCSISGKGKGTPALKNGIKCFKVDPEDDSDAMSDWQGF